MTAAANTQVKEFYLINQSEEHNKFIIITVSNHTFSRRWGRLGLKGQSKKEDCGSTWNAEYEARNYQRTKQQEGYTLVSKADYERMAVEASIVGSSNKCHDFKWVEIASEEKQPDGYTVVIYAAIDEARLMDPECFPGIRITLETRKEYVVDDDTGNKFDLLFTMEKAYARNSRTSPTPDPGGDIWQEIDAKHSLKKLKGDVEAALGRRFSA